MTYTLRHLGPTISMTMPNNLNTRKGFRGLGFGGLGFRGLGFRGVGGFGCRPCLPEPTS